MALPDGFLDELRARVPISEVVGRRVTWDARKSSPARGDFWACCPFHQEKSPSFHVDDRKGFYHCFGCHAKGDAIGFLREAAGMSFMEAVTELASMAGLEVPAQDPRAAERADERRDLVGWMDAAVAYYRTQLRGARATEARAYLARRGLTPQTLDRFEIGFAPNERRGLAEHLKGKGADEEALIRAGLIARPEDGGAAYDRFRDRIMFPIRDAQGRCIAFGGRAMAADARAKYLNSPETPLFSKSRTLFNHGPAREAAMKARSLIVAEGYMDVIALAEAGFGHAVAPLGTAITEDQLRMMWRMADEPVLALDGDKAGIAAAMRAIDVALPMLEAGRTLRFALLPGGRDPDDLIRAEGPQAMRAVLDAAEPMAALLWRRETEGRSFDSPERRAALDARLKAALGRIADGSVREHYRADFARRRAELFGTAGGGARGRRDWGRSGQGGRPGWGGRDGRVFVSPTALPETRASLLAAAAGSEARARVAEILLAALNHPALLDRCGDDLAAIDCGGPDLEAVRRALLAAAVLPDPDRAAHLDRACGEGARALLTGAAPAARYGFARPGLAAETAEQGLREAISRHISATALRREVELEAEAVDDDPGQAYHRTRSVAAAARRALQGAVEQGPADEAHLSDALRAAITDEIWKKKPRRRTDSNH
jgi:DNA primase